MVLSSATVVLIVCALVSAVAAIWSEAKERRRIHYVAKPLATAFIIAVAARAAVPAPAAYKTLVVAGLSFSLLGDVALMLDEKWFRAGVAAFLAAQILYILAFRPAPGHPVSPGTLLPFLLFGLLMFRLLAPTLGPMKLPVFVYCAAITVMAGLAAGRFIDRGGTRSLLAFIGAVLFVVSDSVLAYSRFAKKIPGARPLTLGTYFPAQLLIALSI